MHAWLLAFFEEGLQGRPFQHAGRQGCKCRPGGGRRRFALFLAGFGRSGPIKRDIDKESL
jgi:hypothetical protein